MHKIVYILLILVVYAKNAQVSVVICLSNDAANT